MRKRSNFPVVLFRLVVPLLIFVDPFWGGLAALAADDLDVILIDVFHLKKFSNYPTVDKLLDTYYLTFELIVSLSWTDPLARTISVGLFVFRLIGLLVAYATGKRAVLLIFPNIFEYFFLIYIFFLKFYHLPLSPTWQILTVILLVPPKLLQEYVLHCARIKPWERFKKSNKISFG